MPTTTEVANISELLDLSAYAGEYASDYDMEAVEADYVTAIDKAAGPGIYVTESGLVFAELSQVERARGIDWRKLTKGIDVGAIFMRHDNVREV